SIFHFMSDEEGRAPNAISYISAGIGFCYMTQLGRYAKIAKKDMSSYTITQDTHFSKGGASGGTGKPGTADPVETHVYIDSEQDDDFARTVVDMGEQTCFLHAFCRTDLKAKIKISDYGK
ncbi:MAG: OsmC family peroxiredoxin, partial [Kordiimonadaceae bacterium]|nr:OsmC family peroxiredoxin [Kordiimonadaceae bacterium]